MTLHKKPISFALWLGASLVTPAMGWATQVPAPQHTQQKKAKKRRFFPFFH